jgi:hypothetical protein
VWVCSADETTIVCNADTTVGAERCDSIDNDCDGETDEDWRSGMAGDLDNPCEVGVGECRRSGVFVCTPDELATVCDADYVSGTPEICDGRDNDCDGTADDGCTPEPGTVYCCDGLTSSQQSACVQIALPSSLYARWDRTTCELFSGSTPAGADCSVSSQCVYYNFDGVCGLNCTSHAGLCLNDTSRSYCTKQCASDAECPMGTACRLTATLWPSDIWLCRSTW